MNLTVNGQDHIHTGTATIQGLLDGMGIDCARVAVMVNDQVISRQKYASAKLHGNDRVEILTFAGGG